MKTQIALILALVTTVSVNAALLSWNSSFQTPVAIPDGAPTGWSDTHHVSGLDGEIVDVNVRLTTSGGYNGDLYVYLAYNGQSAVLLNRPGRSSGSSFGYGDSGLNVTFSDQAAADIHSYREVSGFSISGGALWQPDARASSPLQSLDSDPRTKFLSSFNGMSGNGGWTLFVADLSGGGAAQLSGWGLDIETVSAVPEPVTTALLLFACLAIPAALVRSRARRRIARLRQE